MRKSEDLLVDFSVRITADSEFIAFAEKTAAAAKQLSQPFFAAQK